MSGLSKHTLTHPPVSMNWSYCFPSAPPRASSTLSSPGGHTELLCPLPNAAIVTLAKSLSHAEPQFPQRIIQPCPRVG